jgi:hypothetical protein
MPSIQNRIESKAVHIYALNEYRWGFDQQALTQKQDSNYPVNIIEGNFIEIGLPGAHSDIGGSYSYNDEDSIQFANNALLACPPLALMVKHAIENGVSLVEELSDGDRKDAANAIVGTDKNTDKDDGVDGSRSYDEMIGSYDFIKPYIENEKLRAPMGLWREHIALANIYQYKLTEANKEFKDLWDGEDNYYQLQSDIQLLERKLKSVNTKILLSEQQLKILFSSESDFKNFKSNYEILYQKYMHRSHAPFNTTFGMGKQDADENFWLWNKTLSDDRPHRDIFYNSFKDFEKINIKKTKNSRRSSSGHKGHGPKKHQTAPEYKILNSVKWNDPA